MSVEKIVPLPPVATDAQSLRIANRAPIAPTAGLSELAPTIGAAEPTEGLSHLFDSLVLPLPDAVKGQDHLPSAAVVRASYAQEAARPMIATLLDGRLTEDVILRQVETLLGNAADERGVAVRRLIEAAPRMPPDRLPSQNARESAYTAKGRIPAYDDAGDVRLFDLYLARVDAERWEATVFRHEPAKDGSVFPYPAPPVSTYRLLIDPGAGLVLASVMEQMIPRPIIQPPAAPLLPAIVLGALPIVAVGTAVVLLLGNLLSWRIAALFAAAVLGFLIRGALERKAR
jgi:hypothetical protein